MFLQVLSLIFQSILLSAEGSSANELDYTTVYLFIAFILLGLLVVILNKYTRKPKSKADEADKAVADINTNQAGEAVKPMAESSNSDRPEGCCGMHEVCEKEFISTKEIVYFADEELDVYAGREADDYTEPEIAEFEDVLLTLKENEIEEWLISLQQRGIILPSTIKDEAMLIITENRLGV